MTWMGRIRAALVLAAFVPAVSSCSAGTAFPSVPASDKAPVELRVSAAASLKKPFQRLQPVFEKASGVRLVYNFAASGVLQRQIEAGAPADVFASASPKQVDALIDESLVSAEDTRTFATVDLVLAVPEGNPGRIESPRDLSRARLVAVGDPQTAPHGMQAQKYLSRLGLWRSLEGRVSLGSNAEETLRTIERREADAGFVFASQLVGGHGVRAVFTVPSDLLPRSRYVVAPVFGTRQPAAAAEFVEFLGSPAGQAFLATDGFLPASP